MVEADPARQEGRLAWLWAALRLDGWRRVAIGLLPLAVALVLALAHDRGWFQATDRLAYDLLTLEEAGWPPRVVIADGGAGNEAALVRALLASGVRQVVFQSDPGIDPVAEGIPAGRVVVARTVEKVAGRSAWRFAGPEPAVGLVSGASVLARAEAGLHRRQIASLPGERGPLLALETAATGTDPAANPYWLRLSRNQNLPRIAAHQVLDGEVGAKALSGTIVLVERARSAVQIATPRDGPGTPTTLTEFRALAIQTLLTGRAARPFDRTGSTLLLAVFALLTGLIYLRSDPKRIMPLLLLASLATIGGGAWLALELANVLLPVTALVLAQPLAALLVLHRAELSEDRNLRRFVTRTINLSSRQVLLKDLGRLPQFLAGTAPLLGVGRSLVLEQAGSRLTEIEAGNASIDELVADQRLIRAHLRRARRAQHPIDAAALVPGWTGTVRLAALGPAKGEVFWLYAFEPGREHAAAQLGAAGIAGDYRAIQQLRADLSAGFDRKRAYRPADEWAGGAARLIADHGQQVATGIDALETAVAVFNPIGFPLHANAPMAALYEKLGLALADAPLVDLLAALTSLDPVRIRALINDLLVHGGEMRVDAREIDTRTRQVRIAAIPDPAQGRPLCLAIEAVDISEPRRLARLRLTLAHLLDVSIRNDLVAIGFALAAVRTGKLSQARLDQALARIGLAAERATGRLDELAPHLQTGKDTPTSQSYPIDAVASADEAIGRVAPLAEELQLEIAGARPGLAGFTIADPKVLTEMIEAMLRIVLADCAPGESIQLDIAEEEGRTRITLAGGIGMAFERLYAALENLEDQAAGPFRAIATGMAAALGWGAVVSYSSRIGKGYRFVIEMRRIG